MNLPPDLLSPGWLWTGHLLFFPLLLWALRHAPWHYLKNAHDANVLFAGYVALYVFWRMGMGLKIAPGMEFHLLLVTSLTLMFGWAFAIIGVSVVQLALTVEGRADWAGYSLNVLCNGVIPILATYVLYRSSRRWLPAHFFVYIYLCAFAGGALALLASRCAGMGVLWMGEVYAAEQLVREYIVLLPIMMFPEAFLNGGIMTLLVVFRPQWVSSFQDEVYLRGK